MGTFMTDKDWQKVKYFKKEEFKCGCGGRYCNGYPHEIAKSMVFAMDDYRTICGATIITSGLRCQRYNDELEGSVIYSDHIVGQACDILTPNYLKVERTKIAKGLWNLKYTYTNEANMYNAIHCSFNLYDYPEEVVIEVPKVEEPIIIEPTIPENTDLNGDTDTKVEDSVNTLPNTENTDTTDNNDKNTVSTGNETTKIKNTIDFIIKILNLIKKLLQKKN